VSIRFCVASRLRPPFAVLVSVAIAGQTLLYPPVLQAQPGLRIQVLRGEGAVNSPGGRAGDLEVEVHLADGRPAQGATVTFILPTSGPGASFLDGSSVLLVNADDQGRAVARGIRANEIEGEFAVRVNASLQGANVSISIRQRNSSAPVPALPPPGTPTTAPGAQPKPPVAVTRPAPVKKSSSGKWIAILAVVGGGAAGAALGLGGKKSGGGGGPVTTNPPVTPPPVVPSITITPGSPNVGRP